MEKNEETTSIRLKKIRKENGLTQVEMATKLRIPQSSYSKYEKGASMPDGVLAGIYHRLGVNLNWLISGVGKRYRSIDDDSVNYDELKAKIEANLIGAYNLKYLSGRRLREWRIRMGYTDDKIDTWCALLGLERDKYLDYEKQRYLISDKIVERLTSCGCRKEWLYFGSGTMMEAERLDSVINPQGETVVQVEKRLALEDLSGSLVEVGTERDYVAIEAESSFLLRIPKQMACRLPDGSTLEASVVSGDSMEPTLSDGDRVVYAERYIKGDGIYVLAFGHGQRATKRVQFDLATGTLKIISDNARYPAVLIPLKRIQEKADIDILGKVVVRIHNEL